MGPRAILRAIWRVAFLRHTVLVTLAILALFPLYDRFVAYPAFESLVIGFTEEEATRVAAHLGAPLRALAGPISRATLPPGFVEDLTQAQGDFSLEELNVYSADGEVVFATDAEDLGTRNQLPYFREVVAQGRIFTNMVRKDDPTMEARKATRDVVETYIPIMRGGTFIGAFEIYYDVTARRQALDRILTLGARAEGLIAAAVALVVLLVAGKAARSVVWRERAEAELRENERRLSNITAGALDAIFELDQAGLITFWNPAAERVLGYPRHEALGRPLTDLVVPPHLHAGFAAKLAGLRQGDGGPGDGGPGDGGPGAGGPGAGRPFETVAIRMDRREMPVEVSLAASGGQTIGVLRDISQRNLAELRLKLGARVIERALNGIVVTDERGTIQMVNPAFTTITGYTGDEAIGRTPRLIKSGRHPSDFYAGIWRSLNQTGEWQGEIWNRRKSGEIYPEWLSLSAIYDGGGRATHYVGVFSDITQRKAAERDLERLAFYDPLTGLANRLLLRERLGRAIQESTRYGGERIAVLYIDLDRFKEVNDSCGHQIGDLLLQEAARRLQTVVRAVDTVARLGGDEFAVVLKAVPDVAAVEVVAAKIVAVLAEPFDLAGTIALVSSSVGIALHPDDATEIDDLIGAADGAMYEAKRGGRDRYAMCAPGGGFVASATTVSQ